jgi:hypothetical protein
MVRRAGWPQDGTNPSHNSFLGGQCARAIENACHWSLDVTFREDDSRVRERVLGSDITWLYRFTLSILKQHPDRRQRLIMKRRGCGWSDTFLMEVIATLTC